MADRRPRRTEPCAACGRRSTVAVMGCTVNGPGEAREADIGLACGRGSGVIFKKGRLLRRVRGAGMVETFIDEVKRLDREASGRK